MKHKGRITAAVCAAAITLGSVAYGATYYGNYDTSNMWTDVFRSEQTRLYGSSEKYTAWPGAKSDHHTGIMAAISYGTTKDVSEVFGENCKDLLFSSIDSTKNYKDYFVDEDRLLEPCDIAEWNGFLFALCQGAKSNIVSKTETFTYGSGQTVTENIVQRDATSEVGKTGNDSYLYVFDISEGKNYGEALVAKWHIDDVVGTERNAFSTFESVSVNDDFICLLVNNNAVSGDDNVYSYDRGLVILKNNIKRGAASVSPVRADEADEDYRYGARVIAEASQKGTSASYETAIVGDYYMIFPKIATNMVTKGDKTVIGEEKIIMLNLAEMKKSGKADKLSVVISDIYKEDTRTINASLDELLPIEGGWHNADGAVLCGIKVNGSELSFLVTYQEDGQTVKHLFITDWTDAKNPTAKASFKYTDQKAGTSPQIYEYEGYYYIVGSTGIDVIRKYDSAGKLSPEYVTTYVYDAEKWSRVTPVGIFVTGNYLWAWNQNLTQSGNDIRLKLSDDKSEILESSLGTRNRIRALNCKNDVIRYNDRVYVMATSTLYGSMPPCINVIDLTYSAPVSVSIDPMPTEISLPYIISGEGTGLLKVAIYIDGELDGYAETKKTESGEYKWQYSLTKSGEHSVCAKAVAFEDVTLSQSADYASYRGTASDEITVSGSYEASGNALAASIKVQNAGKAALCGRLIVGIYKEDVLYSLGLSEDFKVSAEASETVDVNVELPTFLSGYTVKAFLTESGGFKPLTTKTELKGF